MKLHLYNYIALLILIIGCSGGNSDMDVPPEPLVPPFSGTIFLDADILTSNDSSIFTKTSFKEITIKNVFDRRLNGWVNINAYTYTSEFSDNSTILAVVNEEFGSEEAAKEMAEKFSLHIGQLPKILRKDIDELWIHKGIQPFGGGNRSVLIHTGQSDLYEQDGILEETLIHEASHTSLDDPHATSSEWLRIQELDGNFISTYSRDNAQREDIAESFLMYLAVKYRIDRISPGLKSTIESTIPHRLSYFDDQNFDLTPFYSSN